MSHITNMLLSITILSLFLFNSAFTTELKTVHFSRGRLLPSSSKRTRNLDTSDLDFAVLDADVAVAIDFGEAFYNKVEDSDFPGTMMILEISSNETGFNGDNSQMSPFGYFDCDPSYCSEDNSAISYDNSWFSTTASRISVNTSISMGEGAWQLKTPALYFKNFSFFYDGYSPEIYGWVGLGTGSNANTNFQTPNPIFSILLNSSYHGAGSLMFGFNSSIADLDNPLMVVPSDENWGMQMTSLSFGSTVFSNTTNPIPVIFDLMITGIIMPQNISEDLISQMATYNNMICFNGGCEGTNITGLPSLIFGMAGGQNLTLTPEMLFETSVPLDDGSNTTFYETLEIRYSSHHEKYENNIVLGWDVLANFYTLFQQTNGVNSISFYQINSATPPSPNSNPQNPYKLLIIIGGSLAFLVICICVGVFIIRKNKAQRKKKIQEKLLVGTELNESVYSEISEPKERYCML